MKLLGIVGSLRKESYNLAFAKTIQERFNDRFEWEFADIRSLPLFDQDDEQSPAPSVLKLRKQVQEADGVIIVTPEYNWSIPGALKNALDWLSRVEQPLIGKPVMTAGVSTGIMGTIRAQLHLREVLAAPGIRAKLLPPAGNELLINLAAQKFDATGRLKDESTLQHLDGAVGRFLEFVQSAR